MKLPLLLKYQDPRARSKLRIEGISLPVGSDRAIKERLLHLTDRGKLMRDIDGEARWVANKAGGRIYGLEISFDDMTAPALDDVWEGNVYTITPALYLGATIWPGQTSVTVNRTPIAPGVDPEGIIVEDRRTGARVAGWTQSGTQLRTINIPAARATETIVWYRFTNTWMLNNGISVDRDGLEDKYGARLVFEEQRGSSAP